MLNLIYIEQTRIVITGFKTVFNSPLIKVRYDIRDNLIISPAVVEDRPERFLYFESYNDPMYKPFLMDYMREHNFIGMHFACLADEYYLMPSTNEEIKRAIEENKRDIMMLAKFDPDNVKFVIL